MKCTGACGWMSWKAKHLVVLVDLLRRNLAAHDLAEDAVLHAVHAIALAVARPRVQRFARAPFRRCRRCPRAARSSASTSSGPRPCRASSTRQWNQRSAISAVDARVLSPSFAAMTVSVASSPIFFRIASSPFANSARDVGRRRIGALARRDRRARGASQDVACIVRQLIAVDRLRVLEHRLDRRASAPSSSRWKKQRSRPV